MTLNKIFVSMAVFILAMTLFSSTILPFMGRMSTINTATAQTTTFNIGIVGDHGWDNSGSRVNQVIDQMEANNVDLILHPGDFSYSTSCGSSTTNAWWAAWQTLPAPKIAALGNHDGTCASNFLSKYQSSSGQNSWVYSVVNNGVQIITINTEESSGASTSQVNFVKQKLIEGAADPNVKWTIVQMHKQMKSSSSGSSHAPIPALWNAYNTMFDQYGVDLVIQAHMHNYERMKNNEYKTSACSANLNNYNEQCGPTYFVVGTGGRGVYQFESIHADSYIRSLDHGYLDVEVRNDRLVGKFINTAGAVRDTFTITKSNTVPPTPDPGTPTQSAFDKQKALEFIKSMYNPTVGMIKECPACTKYWLWSDQLVGQIALKHIDPGLAQSVETKMNSYSNIVMKNPWATLDPQYRANFAVGGTTERQIGTSTVWYSDYNGATQLECNLYADVAFLKAIHLFKTGQPTAAEQCYDAGRAMWDGVGMKDSGQITGEYAVYKTALGLLAQKITGFTPIGIPSNYFDRFQSITNGGVTTDINAGVPAGSQNVETTFAVLAAIDPNILNEPPMPDIPPAPNQVTLETIDSKLDNMTTLIVETHEDAPEPPSGVGTANLEKIDKKVDNITELIEETHP